MRHTGSAITVDHALGLVGLFLMLVVARLAAPASSAHTTAPGRAAGFAARRAIDAIGAIGWLFDRLPAPAAGAMPRAVARDRRAAAHWV